MGPIWTLPLAVSVALITVGPAHSAPSAVAPPLPQNILAACPQGGDARSLGLHVEVRDVLGLWGGGQSVQVSSTNGFPLVAINCDGPWANFALQPGKYRVVAFFWGR